jgi:hypothetical protein
VLAQPFPVEVAKLGESAVTATTLLLVLAALFIGALMGLGWWLVNRSGSRSPYTGSVIGKGTDILFPAVRRIHDFLEKKNSVDNLPFSLEKAAVCRQTGRIFPDSINTFGVVRIGRKYVSGYRSGDYRRWADLTAGEREHFLRAHGQLEGYQTVADDPIARPGPLYIDIKCGTAVGWQCVPGTDLEVLIVQKPKV